MDVKIISEKWIKPSDPTPSHLQKHSISFLDQFVPRETMPSILYYPSNPQMDMLEKSLSNILTLFYPLSGRYIKEEKSIHCNDQGVKYIQALVHGPLSQILRAESIQPQELSRFVPEEEQESAKSPLVSIQINIFSCGGLAIGTRITHRIADGFSLSMFLNGWAKACKEDGVDNITVPRFCSAALFPPRDNIKPVMRMESKVVTKRIMFDMETISKLKEECARSNKFSTTEILTALIWRSRINAVKMKHGRQWSSLLKVPFNLRGKGYKKIHENCFGNLFVIVRVMHQGEMRLIEFVDRVRDAINKSRIEYAEAMEEDEQVFFEKVNKARTVKAEDVDDILVTSMINFPLNEVDFGWGKPAWYSRIQRDGRGATLMPRNSDGGVEVWASMEEDEMVFFQKELF